MSSGERDTFCTEAQRLQKPSPNASPSSCLFSDSTFSDFRGAGADVRHGGLQLSQQRAEQRRRQGGPGSWGLPLRSLRKPIHYSCSLRKVNTKECDICTCGFARVLCNCKACPRSCSNFWSIVPHRVRVKEGQDGHAQSSAASRCFGDCANAAGDDCWPRAPGLCQSSRCRSLLWGPDL